MLPEVHVIVQMRVAEQYFSVVLFIIVHKMVLTFESVDEIFKCESTIQMKVTEWQFPVVLFTMPHKVDSSVLRNLPLRLEYLRVRWFNKQSGLYLSLFSLYFVRSFVHHNRSKRSTQNYNAY